MNRLWLELRAPFAAFRWQQAGVYRATSPTMPPSAAWGFLLNLAGIETRARARTPTTQIDPGAPPLRIALGAVTPSSKATLYQQLHTYPVGSSGKERRASTRGAKYWIAPTKRELLVDLHVAIGVEAPAEILDRIPRGLSGELPVDRYGLPFAGDNNFLFERIELLPEPPSAEWYVPMKEDDPPREGTARLTVGIDRSDSSRTSAVLFAPTSRTPYPPDDAWIWVPRAPALA